MKKSRFSEERIIGILKQHEAGMKTADLCREHGISPATFYGWKSRYGGMDVNGAQRLRQMEDEDPAAEATVCRPKLGPGSAEGRDPKKRLELAGLREDVAFAQVGYAVSERRACKLLGVDRASYRYEPVPDRNAELREEVVKLARQKPRYRYRRLHAVLERRGQAVNVKRVYRLYAEEGLAVRRHKRKRLVRDRAAEPRLVRANQEWAMDFIVDGLVNGRMVRILSVVDAFTRECLALESRHQPGQRTGHAGAGRADRPAWPAGECAIGQGAGVHLAALLGWADERKISLVHIQPGRPMQDGHVESFHGRLRDECLNANWFRTLNDVRRTLDTGGWSTTASARTVGSPTGLLPSSAAHGAMEMWKAKNAPHISTASTTTARYSCLRPQTEKLQLWLNEKTGANQHNRKALVVRSGEQISSLVGVFHSAYTPKYGIWLNQAEIEISLFSPQCLGQHRFPSLSDLQREAKALNRKMDGDHVTINWQFTRKEARQKFRYERNNITRSETYRHLYSLRG